MDDCPMIPILCVDDDPALSHALKKSLEKNNEFSVDISLSAEDTFHRLSTISYEAVISRYPVPGMDGREFLTVFRANFPLLPFILFAGNGREDAAFEALNAGADLCIRTDGEPERQLEELKNTVRQSVLGQDPGKTRGGSREQYREIALTISEGAHSLITTDGIITSPGPPFSPSGCDHSDAVKQPVMDGITPRKEEGEGPAGGDRGPDRIFAGTAPAGIFHATPEGTMIDADKAFAGIFGYDSPEEVVGTVNRQGGVTTLSVEPEQWAKHLRQTPGPTACRRFGAGCRKKDGSTFTGMITFRWYNNAGGQPELEGTVCDVPAHRSLQVRNAHSGQRYRAIFDAAGDAMLVVDRNSGTVLEANRAARSLYQYTPEEFCTLDVASLAAGPAPGDGCFGFCPVPCHRRKDGTWFPVEVSESMEQVDNRTVRILTIRDITRRKETEDRARAASRLAVVLFRINEVIVRVRDLETLLFEICRIAVEYGQFRMAWVGLVDRERALIRPVARAGSEEGYPEGFLIPLDASREEGGPALRAFRDGSPAILTDIARDPSRERWRDEAIKRGCRSSAALPFSLHGEVVGVISLFAAEPGFFTDEEVRTLHRLAEDVSFALGLLDEHARRARADQSLAGSEERARFLAALLEMSSQPFFVGYEDGRFGVTNPAFCDLLGYAEPEIRNLSWKDLTPKEFAMPEEEELHTLVVTGVPRRYEKEFIKKDHSRVPVEIFAHRATDSGGNTGYFFSFVTDITARRNILLQTRRAHREWENIFSATGSPALVLDPSRTITEASDAVIRLTGKTRDELRAMKCWQLFYGPESTGPPGGCPCELMKNGGIPETATREVRAFGGTYLVSCTPVPDGDGTRDRILTVATDITGLKRGEQALSDSVTRYRTIFENSTDAVILMTDTILDCNPAAERLWGYSREEIIGHTMEEFSPLIQPDGKESEGAAAIYNLAAHEWQNQFFPWQFRTRDGRLIDTDVSLSSITLRGEKHLVAIVRDITARKHAEEQIEQSEQTLRLITDSVSDMVWLSDLNLMPVFISPSVVRLRGYTLDELQQLPLDRRLAPESCTQVLALRDELTAARDSGGRTVPEPLTIELEFLKKSGGTFWSETVITLIRDDTGKPVRILAVGRDITERKREENRIRRLASFPQLNPEPVIEINSAREITFANPACQTCLEQLKMPGNPAAFLPPDIEEVFAALQKSRSGIILREVPVGDAVFEESLTLSPGGRAVRIHAHDITGRHQASGALARANRKLHLLTGITRHDISNRLTAVLGYIDLAKSSTNDPALQEFLFRSETAAVAIRHQMEFTKEYENLGSGAPVWQDVSSLITASRTLLDLHGIALTDDVRGVCIYADPMFSRIIVHLVDNALRHGGPDISRIHFSGSVTPGGYVLVCEDNGVGIQKKDKAAVFRRVIGEEPRTGLFLIQEILSLTMIMIRETGEPGRGARFELTVPPGAYRLTG